MRYGNSRAPAQSFEETFDLNSQEALEQLRTWATWGRAAYESYRPRRRFLYHDPRFLLQLSLSASDGVLRGTRQGGNGDNVAAQIAAGAAVLLSITGGGWRSRRPSYRRQERLYFQFMRALPAVLPDAPHPDFLTPFNPDEALAFLTRLAPEVMPPIGRQV
jgi:hypothetical protein